MLTQNASAVLIAMLVFAISIGGCQSPVGSTITEYRPRCQPSVQAAPDSRVFVLVRWTPIVPITTRPASSRPARQMPVEVQQLYIPRGCPLGFRRDGTQLIAIANQTAIPLNDAHYEWKTLPGAPDETGQKVQGFLTNATLVTVIVLVIAGCIYLAGRCDCSNQ